MNYNQACFEFDANRKPKTGKPRKPNSDPAETLRIAIVGLIIVLLIVGGTILAYLKPEEANKVFVLIPPAFLYLSKGRRA